MSPNPDLYARMAVPYDSNEAAQAALKAFLEDVAALREKHRIAEVAMIAGAYTGGELVGMTQTLGNQGRSLSLAKALVQNIAAATAAEYEREAARLRALASDDGEER